MSAYFEDCQMIGGSIGLPEFLNSSRQEFSEHRADRGAGHEIAILGNGLGVGASIVTQSRMVEAGPHVVLKGELAIDLDASSQFTGQVRDCHV